MMPLLWVALRYIMRKFVKQQHFIVSMKKLLKTQYSLKYHGAHVTFLRWWNILYYYFFLFPGNYTIFSKMYWVSIVLVSLLHHLTYIFLYIVIIFCMQKLKNFSRLLLYLPQVLRLHLSLMNNPCFVLVGRKSKRKAIGLMFVNSGNAVISLSSSELWQSEEEGWCSH